MATESSARGFPRLWALITTALGTAIGGAINIGGDSSQSPIVVINVSGFEIPVVTGFSATPTQILLIVGVAGLGFLLVFEVWHIHRVGKILERLDTFKEGLVGYLQGLFGRSPRTDGGERVGDPDSKTTILSMSGIALVGGAIFSVFGIGGSFAGAIIGTGAGYLIEDRLMRPPASTPDFPESESIWENLESEVQNEHFVTQSDLKDFEEQLTTQYESGWGEIQTSLESQLKKIESLEHRIDLVGNKLDEYTDTAGSNNSLARDDFLISVLSYLSAYPEGRTAEHVSEKFDITVDRAIDILSELADRRLAVQINNAWMSYTPPYPEELPYELEDVLSGVYLEGPPDSETVEEPADEVGEGLGELFGEEAAPVEEAAEADAEAAADDEEDEDSEPEGAVE